MLSFNECFNKNEFVEYEKIVVISGVRIPAADAITVGRVARWWAGGCSRRARHQGTIDVPPADGKNKDLITPGNENNACAYLSAGAEFKFSFRRRRPTTNKNRRRVISLLFFCFTSEI